MTMVKSLYSMLVLVNYHKDTFFGIGRVRAYTWWVSMYRWIRREVEETLSGVYMMNISICRWRRIQSSMILDE